MLKRTTVHKIECTVCGKLLKESAYTKKSLHTERNVCRSCDVEKRVQAKQARKIVTKERKCLSCNNTFLSLDDYRICDRCKSSSDYKVASEYLEY